MDRVTFRPLKDADLSSEVRENRFSGKTARIERPTADHPQYRYSSPEQLAKAQTEWDVADKWKLERERYVADTDRARQARHKAEAVAAQAKRDERLAAQRDQTLTMLKARYLAVPGMTDNDWEADKEQVLRDYARSEALSGNLDRAARRGLVDVSSI